VLNDRVLITHHYLPLEGNYWHVAFLLGPSTGAVNGDVVVFQDLEQHFWGTPRATSTMLLRRPFHAYVASQLSYFWNVFHVHVLLNLLLWAAALFCLHDFARRELGDAAAAAVAWLAASGTGFVMYVAQPTSYLAAYAAVAILAWAAQRAASAGTALDWATLGVVTGLALLVYDAFAWFLFVAGYALLKRASLRGLAAALVVATALYAGFLALQTRVLGLPQDATNTEALSAAMANAVRLVTELRATEAARLTVEFARFYTLGLALAFFVLPALLAIAGFAVAGHRARVLGLLLLAPSAASVAFLTYGQAVWSGEKLAAMPRFSYAAFPAVYLMAAIALHSLVGRLRAGGRPALGAALMTVVIASMVLLASLDVIAGLPQPYYWFYWGRGGHF
jgi:hypothetical protein